MVQIIKNEDGSITRRNDFPSSCSNEHFNEYIVEYLCLKCHKMVGWPMFVNKDHGGECCVTNYGEDEREKMCKCECPIINVVVDGTVVASFASKPLQG